MVQIFKSCISLWADSVIPMHWYGLIHSIERCCKIVLQNFKELDRGITNYKFGSTRNWSFQLMETTNIRIELWSSYKMFHNLNFLFSTFEVLFFLASGMPTLIALCRKPKLIHVNFVHINHFKYYVVCDSVHHHSGSWRVGLGSYYDFNVMALRINIHCNCN